MITGIARSSDPQACLPGCKRLAQLKRLPVRSIVILACLLAPITTTGKDSLPDLLEAARAMRDAAAETRTDISPDSPQNHARRWLAALLADGEPRFQGWYSERRTFAAAAPMTEAYPFPGAAAGAIDAAEPAHGSHAGPLIHFTHFNAAAHVYLRSSGLYDPSRLHAIASRDGMLPAPPSNAMVVLTGWWPLAADRATPMPLWDENAPLRPTGANGYLNWPRVARVAPLRSSTVPGKTAVQQFAGRAITDAGVLPRDAFYRVAPTPAHLQTLMRDPQFRRASMIALGRPMQAGDELALVAFHLLHFGLEEGLWLTYWWDVEEWDVQPPANSGPAEASADTTLPAPWRYYRGDMTVSPVYPLEADGSPNICFNPWFDAVFPDSGQGNGLRANCVSCHLQAGVPATGRLQVTRGRPEIDSEDRFFIPTHLLWSLANPRRAGTVRHR